VALRMPCDAFVPACRCVLLRVVQRYWERCVSCACAVLVCGVWLPLVTGNSGMVCAKGGAEVGKCVDSVVNNTCLFFSTCSWLQYALLYLSTLESLTS